jgi:hypothetical protein
VHTGKPALRATDRLEKRRHTPRTEAFVVEVDRALVVHEPV